MTNDGNQPILRVDPSPTYHYRLVGINSPGTSLGRDLTFTGGVYQPVPFSLTGVSQLPGGGAQLSFSNLPGLGFTVLGATNVAQPLPNWTALGPAVESPAGSGHYHFTDPQATNYARRFYRVVWP